MPETKKEFVKLFHDNKIQWFHKNICSLCHRIPEAERWLNDTDFNNMKITKSIKRHGNFHHWEPFYIGTNDDPKFDERLVFEGGADKMPQAFALCLLDYKFHILSNGFLIHKNGIKNKTDVKDRDGKQFKDRKSFIERSILPEMIKEYGEVKGCKMY